MRISCDDEGKQDEVGINSLCATKLGYAGRTTDDRRLVSRFGPEKEALKRIHLLLSAFSVEKLWRLPGFRFVTPARSPRRYGAGIGQSAVKCGP